MAKAFVDGGNRRKVACSSAVIIDPGSYFTERHKLFPAGTTNNVVEYEAVILALITAMSLGLTELEIFSDSELVVRQILGEYKIKQAHLKPLHDKVMLYGGMLRSVSISHIRREQNRHADALCNFWMDHSLGFQTPATQRALEHSRAKLQIL